MDDLFEQHDDGPILRVFVQPGAGATRVVGPHGGALKVRVAAPPEAGRANEACAELLAEVLGVAPADVSLVGGDASRQKRFRIKGVSGEDLAERLDRALTGAERSRTAGRRGTSDPRRG